MIEDNLRIDAEFIQNIAHQLISPLQCIQGHLLNLKDNDRMSRREQNIRLKEVIGHVQMTTEMARRINFLYEICTKKASDLEVATEHVPFSAIVSQIIDIKNNYLLMLRQKNMKVEIDTEVMNQQGTVANWRLATQQVVMNLYDNAVKYGKAETITRVYGRRIGGMVRVCFESPGAVIDAEEAEMIFKRGYRGKAVIRKTATGTGLGLWISKTLMEAMGGALSCQPGVSGGPNKFFVSWRMV